MHGSKRGGKGGKKDGWTEGRKRGWKEGREEGREAGKERRKVGERKDASQRSFTVVDTVKCHVDRP